MAAGGVITPLLLPSPFHRLKMFYFILLLASFSFGIEKCRLSPENQLYVEMQVKKEDMVKMLKC
jgi:hypothetical protein